MQSSSRIRSVAPSLVAGLAAAVVVVVIALPLLGMLGAPSDRSSVTGGEPGSVDLTIEKITPRLADGRAALASFTIRLRETDAAGRKPDYLSSRRQAVTHAELREKIGSAVSALRYADTAGEVGKERLKAAVRDAALAALPDAVVTDIFIRDYFVQ